MVDLIADVDIYWVQIGHTTSTHVERHLPILDDEERETYNRYRVDFKKVEFLVGRMLAKTRIAAKLHSSARDIVFVKNSYGKPFVIGGDVSFNLSHTTAMVACAVSDQPTLGLDVELIREQDLDIMGNVFSPQEQHAIKIQETPHATNETFYRIWTRKEAFVKALGYGFALPPSAVSVPSGPGWTRGLGVFFVSFAPIPGYMASVTVAQEPCRIRLCQIPLPVLQHNADHM